MGWLICIGLGLLFGAFLSWHGGNRPSERDFWLNGNLIASTIIAGVISSVLGVALGAVGTGRLSRNDDPVELGCVAKEYSVPIISTSRERSTSGSFVLGAGGVNSVDKYYAYVEHKHGLMLETFYTSSTYIVETNESPHYSRTDWYCERTFRNWFWFGEAPPRQNKGRYGKLHVPENTILREFKL